MLEHPQDRLAVGDLEREHLHVAPPCVLEPVAEVVEPATVSRLARPRTVSSAMSMPASRIGQPILDDACEWQTRGGHTTR